MPRYEVSWKAFGVAEVIADSESEAMEVVSDGCFSYNDIDFERNDVDGVDVEMA